MFEYIFSWFDSLYSEGLGEHLAGLTFCEELGEYDYVGTNLFNLSGIIALVTAAITTTFFYYLWNPAAGMRWKWFLMLGITAFLNLLVGFAIPYTDLINEYINLPEGLYVSGFDCFLFGVSDFIVSAGFFIILSYIIRWGSRNNKHIPF